MKKTLLLLTTLALALGRLSAAETNTLSAADQKAGWQLLFNGTSLDGWKASETPGTFSVQDGLLIVHGKRSHLFYTGPVNGAKFTNFELSLDIKTFPKANSGVYIHTEFQPTGWPAKGYEVQVNNTHSDVKKGAGLYAVKDNLVAPAKDGEWYTMVVRVEGKRIQTFVNGKQIVDFTEPTPATPPAGMPGRLLSTGTIALQGHDPESVVHYRNIKIRPLP